MARNCQTISNVAALFYNPPGNGALRILTTCSIGFRFKAYQSLPPNCFAERQHARFSDSFPLASLPRILLLPNPAHFGSRKVYPTWPLTPLSTYHPQLVPLLARGRWWSARSSVSICKLPEEFLKRSLPACVFSKLFKVTYHVFDLFSTLAEQAGKDSAHKTPEEGFLTGNFKSV